jgi:EAL domain-containing protein (putative c-di-GMP-specific phosphodiesterase class I)
VAEKYGLIEEIDRWVIEQATRLAAQGRRVGVNLSARSVGDVGLLHLIEMQLSAAHVDPGLVTFEITETALMENLEAGERFARGLADMGACVALDDFGTGFGSFTYLKRLPLRYLKIDIDFVRDLRTNPANQHLVNATVGLARDFGYETIAEGVEDAETLGMLDDLGVDLVQGYHLGRPAPIDALVRSSSSGARR